MSILLDMGQELDEMLKLDGVVYEDIKIPDKTVAILIKKDSIKLMDLDIEDEKEYLLDRLRLSVLSDSNKVLLIGGKYSKKTTTINPFALYFNIDTIRNKFGNNQWEQVIKDLYSELFKIYKANIQSDDYLQQINDIQEFCNVAITNNIKEIADIIQNTNKCYKVALLFDIDLEHYKKANKFYYWTMNKMFTDVSKTFKLDGESYGYNVFTVLDSKKPLLLSNILCDKNTAYQCLLVDKNKFALKDKYKVKTIDQNKEKIYYWEYDPKVPEIELKKNRYIGTNKQYAVSGLKQWQLNKILEEYLLKHDVLLDKSNKKTNVLRKSYQRMFEYEELTPYAFKQIESFVIKRIIKDLTTNITSIKEIINILNVLLSVKDYLQTSLGKDSDYMNKIKNIQQMNDFEIDDAETFSYLLGQVVYYINSFGKEAQTRKTMSYIYKYLNPNHIANNLARDMSKYRSYIKKTKLFDKILSQLMMKCKEEKLDTAMFLAGVLDDNIFYKKQKTEADKNEIKE